MGSLRSRLRDEGWHAERVSGITLGFDTCGREGGKTRQSEKLSSASTKASGRTLESFSEELGSPFRVDSLCGDAVGLSYSHIRQRLDANWSPKREGTVWPSASSGGDWQLRVIY